MQSLLKTITILLLTFTSAACGVAMESTNLPKMVHWDLSESHQVEQVGWPADQTTSIYHLSDLTVHLDLPFAFQIEAWQASHVYVKRNDKQQIYYLALRTQPLTMQEAQAEALKLATQFRLDQEKIQSWYRTYRNQPAHLQRNFTVYRNLGEAGEEPEVVLESFDSFNDERPWILELKFTWLSAQ